MDRIFSKKRLFLNTTALLLVALVPALRLRAQIDKPMVDDLHSPEEQIQFADGNYRRGFYDLAEEGYREFVRKYPKNQYAPHAMFRLIRCLRQQGKTGDTLSAINQYQELWPDAKRAAELFLWKGEILYSQERYNVAEACFKHLLLHENGEVAEQAVYFLAQCQAKQGKPDLALRTYARIADLSFDDKHEFRPYAAYAIAAGHMYENRYADAAKNFTRLCAKKSVPEGLRREALYRLAEIRFSKGKIQEAITLYDTLLLDYPSGLFVREAAKRRAWAYFQLGKHAKSAELGAAWRKKHGADTDYELNYIYGVSLVGTDAYTDALTVFTTMAEATNVPVEYGRMAEFEKVVCLLRLDKLKEAVKCAKAFTENYPNALELATVHYYCGQGLFGLGDFANASASFRSALNCAAADWEFYQPANLQLAECLEKVNRHGEAAVVYRQLSADKRIDRKAYFLFRAGEAALLAGKQDEAAADFSRVLSDFPGSAEEMTASMQHLAELYARSEKYGEAEKMIQKLLATPGTKGRARLYYFLGYLCYQQEKYKDAIKNEKLALAEKDGAGIAHKAKFYLAAALLETQETEKALAIFANLLALPASDRPQFSAELLFRLDEVFYARNQYQDSERIARMLLDWEQGFVVYRASLRLASILTAQNKTIEAEKSLNALLKKLREGRLTFSRDAAPAPQEVQSLLGEVYYLQKKNDQAVRVMEACLAHEGNDTTVMNRARWVMGEILFAEKKLHQALRYAVGCFLMGEDPVYGPKGMFLAVQIFSALDRQEDALSTWQDLKKQHTAFAEGKGSTPEAIALEKLPKKTQTQPQ
ncbi:MAG: tetratricopeptide repeat protein [Lentisphaeria bacterium]|nr:tetratricopeptide repeat protein [Lentisphaeria bacterium]